MRKEKTKKKIAGLGDERGIQQTERRSSTSRNMKPLEDWTCQRAENLKKKSSKIPKNNYAATTVSAGGPQNNIGGGPRHKKKAGAPKISPDKLSAAARRSTKVGGGHKLSAHKLSAAAARRGRRTALPPNAMDAHNQY